MTNAKELIAFLTYWAKEIAPDREELQSVTFTVGEIKAVLREASEKSEEYQSYLATLSADAATSSADTSAAELVGYAEFNEELLQLDAVFDPPSVITFTLEQLEALRSEILGNSDTYQGYCVMNGAVKGGIHEPS